MPDRWEGEVVVQRVIPDILLKTAVEINDQELKKFRSSFINWEFIFLIAHKYLDGALLPTCGSSSGSRARGDERDEQGKKEGYKRRNQQQRGLERNEETNKFPIKQVLLLINNLSFFTLSFHCQDFFHIITVTAREDQEYKEDDLRTVWWTI